MRDKRHLEYMMAHLRDVEFSWLYLLDPVFDDAIIGITNNKCLVYCVDIMASLLAETSHTTLVAAYESVITVIEKARSEALEKAPVFIYCA